MPAKGTANQELHHVLLMLCASAGDLYLLLSSPLREFDGSPMECLHHAVNLSSMLRVTWHLQIARGEPATTLARD